MHCYVHLDAFSVQNLLKSGFSMHVQRENTHNMNSRIECPPPYSFFNQNETSDLQILLKPLISNWFTDMILQFIIYQHLMDIVETLYYMHNSLVIAVN